MTTAKTRPLADGIPLDKAWREGRRVYVRCGYTSKLNEQLRRLGATWDHDHRALWVGSGKADQVTPLVRASLARIGEVAEVKARNLWATIPYEALAIREAAKRAEGVYDGDTRRWAMPDQASLDDITAQVAAYQQRIAEQRAADRAEQDRIAALDAEQRAAEREQAAKQRATAIIERAGRTVTGEPSWINGHLYTGHGVRLRRPDAERAAPQPGDVRKLDDGRRALVLDCTLTFFSQDDVDDDFAPGGTGSDPGWYYRLTVVPVAPTAAELAADAADAAERADRDEIAAVMRAADQAAWGKAVTAWTRLDGQTITADPPGGLTTHDGQIIVTDGGDCWYQHPGWYDSYIRREARITDETLIGRVRAILAAGDRRRGNYQITTASPR